ncbi:MAG: hypothetical protein RLZZ245_965 [Verrucomicrobiota bacterium]
MMQIWSQGRCVSVAEFSVSPFDRGLGHGLGLFETILALDGVPILMDRHLARLASGMERLGWKAVEADLLGGARRVLAANGCGSGRARLRLAVTGGSGGLDDLARGEDAQVWMTAVAAGEIPESVAVEISPWTRNQNSPVAGLKCASYAENLLALDHARRRGFQETLFFNTAGDWCEAAMANVFLVKNGELRTPFLSSGCLPGIARGLVLEIAQTLGIPSAERALRMADLEAADEIFLSSAIRGPVPVSRLGEKCLTPGPVGKKLRGEWIQRIQAELACSAEI